MSHRQGLGLTCVLNYRTHLCVAVSYTWAYDPNSSSQGPAPFGSCLNGDNLSGIDDRPMQSWTPSISCLPIQKIMRNFLRRFATNSSLYCKGIVFLEQRCILWAPIHVYKSVKWLVRSTTALWSQIYGKQFSEWSNLYRPFSVTFVLGLLPSMFDALILFAAPPQEERQKMQLPAHSSTSRFGSTQK